MRRGRTRAGLLGPDRGEMALAGTLRSRQQHDPVRPVRPVVDQRQCCGIGRSFEKIVAGKALRVRQRKRELTRMNAACHASLHAGEWSAHHNTISSLAACRTEGGGGDFGAFEASLWLCAQLSSSQAGIRVNMRLMFHAMVTRLHSPRAFSRPRIENCRKPITDLMMPNTGSGVCLRSA